MKPKKLIFALFIFPIICGNVFAVSPYATTIQQNIQKKSFLTPASFPTTAADASFIARMESKRDAYMPYFNRSAFADLPLDEQDELENMAYRAEQERQNKLRTESIQEYCNEYPLDGTNCPESAAVSGTSSQQQAPVPSIYPTTTPVFPSGNVPYMRASLTAENIAKYNLKTYNGGCTPPERSGWFRDYIQTTGRYENTDSPFEKFMITVFRKEGDCGSHPNDRGGYTCYGCASNGLCAGIDMRTITRGRVEDLAYTKIYKQYHIETLPDAFRGYVLWGMWGSGAITGIKQFQSVLGVPLTGKIDAATIRAAENYTGDFADAYTKNREQFYRNIVNRDSSQGVFLRGWLKALELLRPSGCHVVPANPIYR